MAGGPTQCLRWRDHNAHHITVTTSRRHSCQAWGPGAHLVSPLRRCPQHSHLSSRPLFASGAATQLATSALGSGRLTAMKPVCSWPGGTGTDQALAGSQSAAAPGWLQGTRLRRRAGCRRQDSQLERCGGRCVAAANHACKRAPGASASCANWMHAPLLSQQRVTAPRLPIARSRARGAVASRRLPAQAGVGLCGRRADPWLGNSAHLQAVACAEHGGGVLGSSKQVQGGA